MSAAGGARVIINADDFGLTPGVNRGILSAFREGLVTSTTIMVNMRFFEDAVAIARDHAELPVGVHLSLLWGRPVTEPAEVASLVERDGSFPRSLAVLARRYLLGSLDLEHVRLEFRAQIRKFLDTGLVPTHVDTHKHVHCLPGIMQALIDAAGELGIHRLRLPAEEPLRLNGYRPSRSARAKRSLIRWLCHRSRDRLRRAGMRTPDRFVGIAYQECLNSAVLRLILNSLDDGVTEIMCHPGYVDEHLTEFSKIPPHRERELEGLKDPALRDVVNANAIRLMHYGGL